MIFCGEMWLKIWKISEPKVFHTHQKELQNSRMTGYLTIELLKLHMYALYALTVLKPQAWNLIFPWTLEGRNQQTGVGKKIDLPICNQWFSCVNFCKFGDNEISQLFGQSNSIQLKTNAPMPTKSVNDLLGDFDLNRIKKIGILDVIFITLTNFHFSSFRMCWVSHKKNRGAR